MTNLDAIIARMKKTECIECTCMNALFDDTNEIVEIYGSFCGQDMISITATSKDTNNIVWEKECETGRTCSIPFTTIDSFNCN